MKYNLKNKPSNQSDEVVDWFEGFEKELKELCTANAEWRDEWFKRNPRRLKHENPYLPIVYVLQQILGES